MSTTSFSLTLTMVPWSPGLLRAALTRCAPTLLTTNHGMRRCQLTRLQCIDGMMRTNRVRKILGFVKSTLKWRLMDRKPLKTWIHPSYRVILLGDACHPMLVRPLGSEYNQRADKVPPL